jgi:hypothetical protein
MSILAGPRSTSDQETGPRQPGNGGGPVSRSKVNIITLTGRGQIVYTETPLCFGSRSASPYCLGPWPIIGGTGEFQGASSVVTVPADTTWKYGDFVVTFTG